MTIDKFSFDSLIQDVSELSMFELALFYGDAGRGKTNLAASAIHAGFKRVLLVDIEGSAKGVARLNPGVKRVKINSFADLNALNAEILEKPDLVDLVIFDTLNAGQKLAERAFKASPEARINKFAAWDMLSDWTNDWLYDFQAFEKPVIFIAHALDDKNEQTGGVKTIPKVRGSAKENVPTIPDIVGYLQFENINDKLERVLTLGESDTLVTKNRFGLPAKIVNPDIKTIMKLIEDAKGNK